MSDFKLIFIHGYTASSEADWYPAITKELDKLGVDHVVPDLPGGDNPHSDEWLKIVDHEVKGSEKPVVLVGHSLGSRTALLYLDKYKTPVKATFLIAAFANWATNADRRKGDGTPAYPDFFEYETDIPAVKKLCQDFVVIHSLDDDGIDYQQGQDLARDLDAKLVTLERRGHMYEPSNAPIILDILRKELNF